MLYFMLLHPLVCPPDVLQIGRKPNRIQALPIDRRGKISRRNGLCPLLQVVLGQKYGSPPVCLPGHPVGQQAPGFARLGFQAHQGQPLTA